MFFSSYEYSNLLINTSLTILIGTSNSIIAAPTRMQNKRKVFLITNTVTLIISYCIAVPLLIKGMYVIAISLAALISSFSILITFYILNSSWFNVRKVNKQLIKEMMIAKFIGNAEVGIYGIGVRVASVSQLIYAVFASGWQYFAFFTMNN